MLQNVCSLEIIFKTGGSSKGLHGCNQLGNVDPAILSAPFPLSPSKIVFYLISHTQMHMHTQIFAERERETYIMTYSNRAA